MTQLTQDHSVTADLVRRGELQERDALHHPYYGVLTRALGVGPDVEIDGDTHSFDVGDCLLLCSDGPFNEVSSDEIADVMRRSRPSSALADSLVELVVSRDARDNVSVVIAEIAAARGRSDPG